MDSPSVQRKMALWQWLAVAGAYLLCVLVFFYPCLPKLTTHLIGYQGDTLQHYWGFWWSNKAFSEHLNFAHSNFIYYPQGVALFFQPFSFYNLFLSFFLGKVVSLPLTYNIIILQTFVLSGLGAFALAKHLTGHTFGSLVAGFIFAFNPSHFIHSLHHDETASIQFIPFFILFLLKSLGGKSRKDLFLACMFFFLLSICTWYYFLYTTVFLGLAYVYLAWKNKTVLLKDVFLKMSLIVGVTVLLLSPWFMHMFIQWGDNSGMIEKGGHGSAVADLFGFFTPHRFHILYPFQFIKDINYTFSGSQSSRVVYLGIIALCFAAVAYRRVPALTGKYFVAFFTFIILSMGEFVHVMGVKAPMLLPYALMKITPFLKAARYPSRFIVFCYLFLAVIVAFGLRSYSITPRLKRYLIFGIVSALLFLDYFSMNRFMIHVQLPVAYKAIKADTESFGILDLPMNDRAYLKKYMVYQTLHGKPTVSGDILRRVDSSLFDFLELKDLGRQHQQLRDHRVKYIVIHRKFDNNIDIEAYKAEYEIVSANSGEVVFKVY